ncbi:hypothetical protein PCE1_001040 [Barthelona sp. PCE]
MSGEEAAFQSSVNKLLTLRNATSRFRKLAKKRKSPQKSESVPLIKPEIVDSPIRESSLDEKNMNVIDSHPVSISQDVVSTTELTKPTSEPTTESEKKEPVIIEEPAPGKKHEAKKAKLSLVADILMSTPKEKPVVRNKKSVNQRSIDAVSRRLKSRKPKRNRRNSHDQMLKKLEVHKTPERKEGYSVKKKAKKKPVKKAISLEDLASPIKGWNETPVKEEVRPRPTVEMSDIKRFDDPFSIDILEEKTFHPVSLNNSVIHSKNVDYVPKTHFKLSSLSTDRFMTETQSSLTRRISTKFSGTESPAQRIEKGFYVGSSSPVPEKIEKNKIRKEIEEEVRADTRRRYDELMKQNDYYKSKIDNMNSTRKETKEEIMLFKENCERMISTIRNENNELKMENQQLKNANLGHTKLVNRVEELSSELELKDERIKELQDQMIAQMAMSERNNQRYEEKILELTSQIAFSKPRVESTLSHQRLELLEALEPDLEEEALLASLNELDAKLCH